MEQGAPVFGAVAAPSLRAEYAAALSLAIDDLDETLPLQMVSTGLPYLLVPVRRGLERARIAHPAFEELLGKIGAKFVYVFDPRAEAHRDNAGAVEDVATGAPLVPPPPIVHMVSRSRRRRCSGAGRFVRRPNQITTHIAGTAEAITGVSVGGVSAWSAARSSASGGTTAPEMRMWVARSAHRQPKDIIPCEAGVVSPGQ
jgi:predicted PhzF superfamily epimerase YddE/YHI9